MYCWRITKYNPKFRLNGKYERHEWTSFGDIGREFDEENFTYEEYLRIENIYIDAVLIVMKEMKLEGLTIKDLEEIEYREQHIFSENDKEFYYSLENDKDLAIDEIPNFIRLVLREMIWGKLTCKEMFIHFGYDYYMYVGTSKDVSKSLNVISQKGLFVEEMDSPYLSDED